MANKLYNQKVIQKSPAFTVDPSFNQFTYKGFSTLTGTKNFKMYDAELVKQDLINHFYIRKGEKLENPDFGTIIWDILFEPMTEQLKELISKDIQDIINTDPRISVVSLVVEATDQGIQVAIEVNYIPFNVSDKMTLNFDKSNFKVS